MADIDPLVWQQHVDQDIEQSKDLRAINLALFGCPERPDTVKCAIVPTMTRLNNWLDAFRWMIGLVAGTMILSPFWIPGVKQILQFLMS